MSIKIECLLECENHLGEGPVWDVKEGRLYWVDGTGRRVDKPAVWRMDPKTGKVENWRVDKDVGAMALRKDGNAIMALADGFYFFDFDSGKYEQAVGELSNAIHLNTTDLDAYFFRGLAYDKLGQHRRAIKDFDKIIELDAGNNFAYVNRGVVYGKLGRHRKAIQDLDKAIK